MKILVAKGDKPTGNDILTISYGSAPFERLINGEGYEGKAVTFDMPDSVVKAAAKDAAKIEDRWMEVKDFMRDLRWIDKVCAEYEDGTEATVRYTASKVQLTPDKAGRIDRTGGGLNEGDVVAVGPSISPKALMNARGLVVSVNGTKAEVEFEAGDLDRVKRATGKNFVNPVKIAKVCLEKA